MQAAQDAVPAAAGPEPDPADPSDAGRGASAEAIRHHYDVGNAFYRLWLDPTGSYSCALWETGEDALEQAQVRKLEHHIRESGAPGAARVLDIGCGWGGLLQRLVQQHGVGCAVGLTLSEAQAAFVTAQHLPGVEVRLENWLDHRPEAPYGAIVSIGAFEHFARHGLSRQQKVETYRRFFRHCHDWLEPGGGMSLQSIVYGWAGSKEFCSFFDEEIFPESDLPRLGEIFDSLDGLFEVVRLRNDREHYERTLSQWRQRLRARRAEAVALVGEATVVRYEKYFQLCMIGFHVGSMGLARLSLRRLEPQPRPGRA
ncbi:cyclopropane-fatty-acyl-phospholipid synthase family protein [Aquabacterium sp. A7-Y]|uniref:SAM-dependent methyltransferase n=1 Tax=Aquabacterium sp. A7-Y TaxID=1349605 RepID=UPI00223E497C|nr:cyclopropane-fatty-acyl-phospholipid synthase family protein [Aquabacterium sp. A7-Y]MCW7539730.1 cyclopropane-fatty-acyl-phospholipid synthase family protein [Aquabacterium sp. A7-Y]